MGFGFRVSDFVFRVSGFGFRVSGFGFRVSGVKVRVLTSKWREKCPCPLISTMLGRNVERFPGGLVCKAYRLVPHSTLGWGVMKKKKKCTMCMEECTEALWRQLRAAPALHPAPCTLKPVGRRALARGQSRNPKPETSSPKPCTINLTP